MRLPRRTAIWRYLPYLAALLGFLALDLLIVSQNFAPGKTFAGHDAGFGPYFGHRVLELATNTWNGKDTFGFPDFLAPLAIPYALFLCLAQSVFGTDGAILSRIYFVVALFALQCGSFWLAIELIRLRAARSGSAMVAAAFAGCFVVFNPYVSALLSFPVLAFQLTVALWPAVLACGLAMLRSSRPWRLAPGFLTLTLFVTIGNPAHNALGFLLLAIQTLIVGRREHRALLTFLGLSFIVVTAYFWLPEVLSVVFLHGPTIIREGVKYGENAIFQDQLRESARASLSALFRFDGDSWWSSLSVSTAYTPAVRIAGYVVVCLASVSLILRRQVVIVYWCALLVGVEMAKDVHGPFPVYSPFLFTHFKPFIAFRETYDKFGLLILVTMPVLAALGLYELLNASRVRWQRGVILTTVMIATLILAQPMLLGRVATPLYQTSVPADYKNVARLLSGAEKPRALILPGNYLDISSTNWFLGMNLDSYLLGTNAVNGTVFRQRSISAAPLYGDLEMRSVADLAPVLDMASTYGLQYVILHRDSVTEHSPFERSALVYGPLYAKLAKRVLDARNDFEKVFDGSRLIVYRKRNVAARFSSFDGLVTLDGTEANLLPAARFNIHGPLIVAANSTSLSSEDLNTVRGMARLAIGSNMQLETAGLYPEQVSSTTTFDGGNGPRGFIYVKDHGDFVAGFHSDFSSLSGTLPALNPRSRIMVSTVYSAGIFPVEEDRSASALIRGWRPGSVEAATDSLMRDGGAVPDNNVVAAPYQSAVSKGAAHYVTSFGMNGYSDEVVTLGRELSTPIALAELPTVSLAFELPRDPDVQGWVRFVMTDPSSKAVFYDKEISGSSLLWNFDLRSAVQGVLDEENQRALQTAWNRPEQRTRANFLPPQADDYRLTKVEFVVAKRHGVDAQSQGFFEPFSLEWFRVAKFQMATANEGYTRVAISQSARCATHPGQTQIRRQNLTIVSIDPVGPTSDVQCNESFDGSGVGGIVSANIDVPASLAAVIVSARYSVAGKPYEVPIWATNSETEVDPRLQAAVTVSTMEGNPPGSPVDQRHVGGWRQLAFDSTAIAAIGLHEPDAVLRGLRFMITAANGSGSVAVGLAPTVIKQSRAHDPNIATLKIGDARQTNQTALGLYESTTDFGRIDAVRNPQSFTVRSKRGSVDAVAVLPALWQRPHELGIVTNQVGDDLYEVVAPSQRQQIIMFASTYHPGWALIPVSYIPSSRLGWLLSMKWLSPSVSPHIIVNGYENGWIIRGGRKRFVLDFLPQNFLYLGILISITGLAIAIVSAALIDHRTRR